jgi:hypothetical protein
MGAGASPMDRITGRRLQAACGFVCLTVPLLLQLIGPMQDFALCPNASITSLSSTIGFRHSAEYFARLASAIREHHHCIGARTRGC